MAQHSHLKELSVNAQTEEPGDHDAEPVTRRECHICSNHQKLRRFLWMFCECLMFLLSILSLVSLHNRFFSLHCALFIPLPCCCGKAHEAATLAHHQDTFVVILQLGPVADVWEEAHQKCRTQEHRTASGRFFVLQFLTFLEVSKIFQTQPYS